MAGGIYVTEEIINQFKELIGEERVLLLNGDAKH